MQSLKSTPTYFKSYLILEIKWGKKVKLIRGQEQIQVVMTEQNSTHFSNEYVSDFSYLDTK